MDFVTFIFCLKDGDLQIYEENITLKRLV